MLRVDINNIFPFVEETALKSMHDELDRAHRSLEAGDGLGSVSGWLRLPVSMIARSSSVSRSLLKNQE